MKKKGLLLLLTISMLGVWGCANKAKTIDTDKLTISKYDGIEIDTSEIQSTSDIEVATEYALWDDVVENTVIKEYPSDALEDEMAYIRNIYEQRASDYGISYEEFLSKYMKTDASEMEKTIEETAKANVRDDLIIDAIIEAENLEVSEDYIQSYMEDSTEIVGFESTDKAFDSVDERFMRRAARRSVVRAWLADHYEDTADN